jgi:cytochrome c553
MWHPRTTVGGLAGAAALGLGAAGWAQTPPGTVPPQVAACAVCHGAQGLALAPDAPHLAGQPVFYLSAQLKAYRSGARRHEVMGVIAKAMTDADIEATSAWYAAQRIRIEASP